MTTLCHLYDSDIFFLQHSNELFHEQKKNELRSSVHCCPVSTPLVTTEFYYFASLAEMPMSPSDVPSTPICIFNLHLCHLHCPIAPVSSDSWQWRRRHEQASSERCPGQPGLMGWLANSRSTNQMDAELFLENSWQWDTNLGLSPWPSFWFCWMCRNFIILQGSAPVTNVETG